MGCRYVRILNLCYNLHMTEQPAAYHLWALIENERVTRGWGVVRMADELGTPRNTINRLKTSPRKADPKTIHKIADGLARIGVEVDGHRITREDAERMAGLRPPAPGEPGSVSVRDAILADPTYTEQQRQTMLQLVDLIEQSNQAGGNGGRRAS